MNEKDFLALCKREVVSYANKRPEDQFPRITEDDVYAVWLCKTLQNSKALLSTTVPDTMYYELTYNGDKGELYLDAYAKRDNICIIV